MHDAPNEFLCQIRPARAEMPDAPTDDEARLVGAHFEHLQRLHAQGVVTLAGRTLEPPHVGLIVIRAESIDDARALMAADPAIEAGVFTHIVQPFRTALGYTLGHPRDDTPG